MANNKFSISIDQLAANAQLDVETIARKVALDLFSSVVARSPVGNPDIWKANEGRRKARETYNATAAAAGQKQLSVRTLKKKFQNVVGKGYVGGRFRANWNFSYGTPDGSTTDSTQKQRGQTEANKAATMNIGGVAYLSNGLVYAQRLEYGAWSKQAPTGMVRVTAIEFGDKLRKALENK